jgi:uncharacterized protein YidB (DUF937 family)
MEKSSAQMISLLGLLAVAGYQNRDRLGELLGHVTGRSSSDNSAASVGSPRPAPATSEPSGGGLGGFLGGLFGSAPTAADANKGLRDIVDVFTGRGHGDTAQSWVQSGPNREIGSAQLQEALGSDTLDALEKQTGLQREDILSRLSAVLPTAVDKMTPDGRLPDHTWKPG